MKLAGMIFIVASAGSVGFQMARSLKERCRLYRQMLQILQMLHSEISLCCTALPKAFALAAVTAQGVLEQVFSQMAREMERRRWLTPTAAMEEALGQTDLPGKEPEFTEILLSLAGGLGKYDRECQLRSLDGTKTRLEELLRLAEQARKLRSKTYKTLGICAGLSMAILLI